MSDTSSYAPPKIWTWNKPNGRGRWSILPLGRLSEGNRLMPSARRFPPPWTAEETDASFIVRDATSGIPRPGAGHRTRGAVLTRQPSTGKSGPLAPPAQLSSSTSRG